MSEPSIFRFSSRRQRLDRSFLVARLKGANAYDRIAGYFSSSLLEIVGEELESVEGTIRIICNSDLHPMDVQTAKAAKFAVWRSWTRDAPERLLEPPSPEVIQSRFKRLYYLLVNGKMHVRVLPDEVFGLIHGKAGVITLSNGSKTCFIGSVNESKSAWRLNYELVWEDTSIEGVSWVQEEFDALWGHPQATPLSEAVIQDIERLARRRVILTVDDWVTPPDGRKEVDPASAIIETPVYRKEFGLWEHQKHFVKIAFEAHRGPHGKARFILADQVGLGKTIQLAMAAQLIALSGSKPILVICPKTLIWQWQDEMRDLLDMPSAVWDGRRWIDERGFEYPVSGSEAIRKSPRRIGIISSGLISHGSENAFQLLRLQYDCVILDEAHRARRRNLGENRDDESPDPNNLLRFMYQLAERTQSLLIATATPVQLRPIEAWDLLDVLSRGDESVLGNQYSRWRHGGKALELIMGREVLPTSEDERWEWIRNPFPSKWENRVFEIIRWHLNLSDNLTVIPGHHLVHLQNPDRTRLDQFFSKYIKEHNPFIQRIIRRTRTQLENQIDPETQEPFIKPVNVELYGENEKDALILPPYLREAYELAEKFSEVVSQHKSGAGILKTLLLRRMGSSIFAGFQTASKILGGWAEVSSIEDDDELENNANNESLPTESKMSYDLSDEEREVLQRFLGALEANRERDPKYAMVVQCLHDWGWLELGCIIFSQYRDSIQWLGEQLTEEFPEESIALYSGPTTSGILHNGNWTPTSRETIKEFVRSGQLRLLLGTDAASEGLNLQRLATLINLDLPWNPTRLEQRKGRIQRIGQIHESVKIYNLRYKDSVEDRVHQMLSTRLRDIYNLFGQLPDVLEDAWVAIALGEKEDAQKLIDNIPKAHPFELRYSNVEKVDWESCAEVLSSAEKRRILNNGWG